MNPGMFIQVPAPQRNYAWIAEPHQLREQIQKAEALAAAVMRLVPVVIGKDAVERMGYENIGDALDGFKTTLRDFLCCELEQKLADQLKNPLPTEEQMQEAMNKARRAAFTKPSIETLMKAQQKVSLLEDAIAKIEERDDDDPIKEYGETLLIPQYRIQLEQEREWLSQIQKAMEEPDPDEAAESPMSNGTEPGEVEKPKEAEL